VPQSHLLSEILPSPSTLFDTFPCQVLKSSPMDPGTLTHNFARIARRAGLTGTRFHDLRHTFASLMLLAGIHPKIVSEALGHSEVLEPELMENVGNRP